MASGRSNKLVGQTGEYLVAAELSRRGLIATTFTGSVPHYDIIASDESGKHVSVQVKTARGVAWQFGNVRKFFDIQFDDRKQLVGKVRPCPVRGLVMVFVKLDADGQDRFYILTWRQFCGLLAKRHKAYLLQHKNVRPKKWDSLHAAIKEEHLQRYRDKWETVEKNLK